MSLYKKLQALGLFLTSRNMVANQECKARPLFNKEVEVFVMDLYKQVEQVSERSDYENLCEAKKDSIISHQSEAPLFSRTSSPEKKSKL